RHCNRASGSQNAAFDRVTRLRAWCTCSGSSRLQSRASFAAEGGTMRCDSRVMLGFALALAAFEATGCSSSNPEGASAAGSDALIVVSDYSSSGVGHMTLAGEAALTFGVDLGKDPALAISRQRAFFVARDLDLLFELNPASGQPTRKTNVHDARARG